MLMKAQDFLKLPCDFTTTPVHILIPKVEGWVDLHILTLPTKGLLLRLKQGHPFTVNAIRDPSKVYEGYSIIYMALLNLPKPA